MFRSLCKALVKQLRKWQQAVYPHRFSDDRTVCAPRGMQRYISPPTFPQSAYLIWDSVYKCRHSRKRAANKQEAGAYLKEREWPRLCRQVGVYHLGLRL